MPIGSPGGGYDLNPVLAGNKARLCTLAQRLKRETGRSVYTVAADLNSRSDLARSKPSCATTLP